MTTTLGQFQTQCESFETKVVRSPQSTVQNTPQKPKRKRVRRERIELDQLRLESHKLQRELAQLQGIHNGRDQNEIHTKTRSFANSKITDGYQLIAPRKKELRSVWQEIARRQLQERWKAQTTNRELREQLQAEYELGRQMMVLLHRNVHAKHSTELKVLNKRRSLLLDHEKSVFKDQELQAESALLEMEKILLRPAYRNPRACFVNTFFEESGNTQAFVLESNMTLPFASQVTANAVWKVMTTDKMKYHCYEHCVVFKSDTVVSQAFGIHFITDVSDAEFRCKYTVRRFSDDGRIIIVWVALFEPIELNELQYQGVRCRQTGWVEFSDLQLETATTTLARSYSRLSVDADEDAENKELQTRSLFSLAQPIHDKVGTLYSAHLEIALIQEDWKLHGFAEPVTSSEKEAGCLR
ncbi:hypothetical protein L917_12360 [Phytophthora nicotianae]|uniref:Uncharacterized protein n=2 Tax=Phytophthora nicotianae TaxID=4792 RepID=W2R371_PHYN3|nr:hypothetical protein PPTG_02998 [Phytophthora nicotianae INRA-310]ETK81926.1 hypothetical protein L915_12610 [Phytophthora nicotianae]ETL88573.1 hypothetical protein L917_12360 [Phytophthora nicotianae]ETN19867.1 hypothetical protein PPTG_02998 [Phytophthora nicotianae INRA-310]